MGFTLNGWGNLASQLTVPLLSFGRKCGLWGLLVSVTLLCGALWNGWSAQRPLDLVSGLWHQSGRAEKPAAGWPTGIIWKIQSFNRLAREAASASEDDYQGARGGLETPGGGFRNAAIKKAASVI